MVMKIIWIVFKTESCYYCIKALKTLQHFFFITHIWGWLVLTARWRLL